MKYMFKPLMMVMCCIMFMGCMSQGKDGAILKNENELIPWRSAEGQFGYVDANDTLVIPPEYDAARPFQNGFAVVAKDEKYGVINTDNEIVVPLKYPAARLVSEKRQTFLFTKREYNAWWQFWRWKILPGFNILGGNDGPFLTTKVPKAEWKVRTLPDKRNLLTKRELAYDPGIHYWKEGWTPWRRSIPNSLSPNIIAEHYLPVGERFYKIQDNGSLKKLDKAIVHIINDSTFVYQNNKHYYIGDPDGKPITDDQFTAVDEISARTNDGTAVIPKENSVVPGYPTFHQPVYKNEEGQYFITPAFNKGFPKKVGDYKCDSISISGKKILEGAVIVTPWQKDYFAIVSLAGHKKGYQIYLLKDNGEWNDTIPNYNGVNKIKNGRIILGHRKGHAFLDKNLNYVELPGKYKSINSHEQWFFVRDTTSDKYGVYDIEQQDWLIEPQYSSLKITDQPNIAIYGVEKKDAQGQELKRYGLLNLKEGKAITPPRYEWISEEGKARIEDNDETMEFYINLETGKEYRSKNEERNE